MYEYFFRLSISGSDSGMAIAMMRKVREIPDEEIKQPGGRISGTVSGTNSGIFP